MYNYQSQCIFGCLSDENTQHIFEELWEGLQITEGIKVKDIYGDIPLQMVALLNCMWIEEKRVGK